MSQFRDTHGLDICELFLGVQKYLTMPDYKTKDYAVSLIMANILKTMPIDGVKYLSYFTRQNNVAVWKFDESYFKFIQSEIYYVNENMEIIRIKDNSIFYKINSDFGFIVPT